MKKKLYTSTKPLYINGVKAPVRALSYAPKGMGRMCGVTGLQD